MMDATNSEDAAIQQRGKCGWDELVYGRDGRLQGRRGSELRTCGGSQSHRRGRGLRRGLRLCCCRELRLVLGLGGAGWGGTLCWCRAREGRGGTATGGLGVRQVSGPPSRGGRGGSRRRCGVQGGLGGG